MWVIVSCSRAGVNRLDVTPPRRLGETRVKFAVVSSLLSRCQPCREGSGFRLGTRLFRTRRQAWRGDFDAVWVGVGRFGSGVWDRGQGLTLRPPGEVLTSLGNFCLSGCFRRPRYGVVEPLPAQYMALGGNRLKQPDKQEATKRSWWSSRIRMVCLPSRGTSLLWTVRSATRRTVQRLQPRANRCMS